MAVITVKSQQELDAIPLDTEDIIRIEFGTDLHPAIVRNRYKYSVEACDNSTVVAHGNSSVVAWDNSTVRAYGNSSVVAWDNSNVEACDNSTVVAHDNSSVEAWGNSSVRAYGNSSVEACDNSTVVAHDNSSVEAWGNSSVEAWGNSSVEACDNSTVVAHGNSSVVAWDNSNVRAYDNSTVRAYGNSSVVAWDNSNVEAWGNSIVRAWGNSSVVAYDSSIVRAWGNVQVVDYLQGATIQVSGNARTVYMPKNIDEFMSFYGIQHDKTTATFYKAVHKRNGEYVSDYDATFKYVIGEKVKPIGFDTDAGTTCGKGIHISHRDWALDFGRNWSDLALLEVKVKIKDIVLPKNSDGKVRASEVEVIREVPLEECGIMGKILLKQRGEKI